MVVQSNGNYKVWANGTQLMNDTSTSDMTSLVPGVAGTFANNITVGRNWPDQWTTFNGDIGDVFFYKTALVDADRLALEQFIAYRLVNGTGTSFTITASAGTGGTITPSGAVLVNQGANQTFNIAANLGYAISQVTVDSVNQGAISTYTFTNVQANHTISATFVSVPTYTITASAGANGTISPSGAVVVNQGANQTFNITANTGYQISQVTVDSVDQGAISTYTFTNVQANHTISATFSAITGGVPRTADLLFSCVTDTFPSSGSTGDWASYIPSGQTLTMMGTPTVDTINGVKWEQNIYADGDGYHYGRFASPIACNGATIVVAAKPVRTGTADSNWQSLVNIFYDRLVFGLMNYSGLVCVRRNGSLEWNTTPVPDGQTTILSMVVQPDGTYKVWANGTQIMSITTTSAMTSFDPNQHISDWGDPDFVHHINVGRNNPDGWTVSNGDIGDVFVYKVALNDTERGQLEALETTKFIGGTPTYTITASAGTGGTITPSGAVVVNQGANQTFNIAANTGYSISQVTVDSVNQGPITTYTFNNVQANHTISATFTPITYTITASSGANGSIAPTGAVVVNYGANQTFNMTANSGYRVSRVLVDGANVGAVTSYTFNNVTANHTISVEYISTDFVAYWKFDETSGTSAYDWSGNGKAGTLNGSCTWVAGLTGNAVNIPGGTSYVGVPNGIVYGLTNFTVAAWVKLTSRSANMRIFDFGTSTTNYMEMTPQHATSSGKIQFVIRTSSTTKTVTGTAALPTGSWQHVAVTLSGQTLTLYVQGAQVGQITNCTITPNSLGSTTKNYIGKSQTTSHPYLNGAVDGFRIYNRALTGTEITALYGGGAGPASVGGPSEIIDLGDEGAEDL